MNNLLSGIENAIKNAIEEYINMISEKYENIDSNDLEDMWNSVCKNMKISTNSVSNTKNTSITKPIIKKEIISDNQSIISEVKSSNSGSSNLSCPYVFSKGENKGTICNSKPKSGCQYCSKHQKFEGVGQTEKKKLPKAKSISSASSVASSVGVKKSPSKKPVERILRLNKDIDKFWDEDTQLVFKSRDERVVIGSYRDEKMNNLTEDDINLCQQYGFKYEKDDLIEDDDDDEDEEIMKKEEKVEKKKEEKKQEKIEKKEEKKQEKIEKKEEKKQDKVEKKKDEKVVEHKKIIKKEEKDEKILKKLNITNDEKPKENKKTIMSEITKTNVNIKDIENVLNELQVGDDEEEYEELEEDLEEILEEDY
jgi:hypothetical protein